MFSHPDFYSDIKGSYIEGLCKIRAVSSLLTKHTHKPKKEIQIFKSVLFCIFNAILENV